MEGKEGEREGREEGGRKEEREERKKSSWLNFPIPQHPTFTHHCALVYSAFSI